MKGLCNECYYYKELNEKGNCEQCQKVIDLDNELEKKKFKGVK